MPAKKPTVKDLRPGGYNSESHDRLPPLLCGVSVRASSNVGFDSVIKPAAKQQVQKWTKARNKAKQAAKGSFPLFLQSFLTDKYVKERVVLEFKAEAAIQEKLMALKNVELEDILENVYEAELKLIGCGPGTKEVVIPAIAKQQINFFPVGGKRQTPDLKYGSWSLSAEYRSFNTEANIDTNTTSVFTGLGAYFAWWASSLPKPKKQPVKKEQIRLLQTRVDSMIKAAKSLQTVMYEKVDLAHAMVRLHPNADKNFVSKLKMSYLVKNPLVVALLKLLKPGASDVYTTEDNKKITSEGTLVQYYYNSNNFGELEQLKSLNTATATKKATLAILNPIIVKETTFREVVTSMLKEVFDFSGKKKWDAVTFSVDKGTSDVSRRLSTAILLLQLCVGSRVSGIMFANKIMKLDVRTKQDDQRDKGTHESRSLLLKGIHEPALVRVMNLTKERSDFLAKVSRVMNTSQLANIEVEYGTAKAIVERETADHFIDKPIQYYLLDPTKYVNVQDGGGAKKQLKPSSFYTSSDPARQNPREVFLQLLRQVRHAVKTVSGKKKLPWAQYNMDDGGLSGNKTRMIDYIDYKKLENQTMTKNFLQLHQVFYKHVNEMSRFYLGAIKSLGDMTTTHTLRRLYTCYSFEYFGRGRLKEVGYAQYVLRHKSIETSIRYTVVQFDMTIDSVAMDKALLSDKMTRELNEVKSQFEEIGREKDILMTELTNLKRKFEELDSAPLVKKQKTDTAFVRFMDKDGQETMVQRKPRSVRGMTEDAKIVAGLEVADRLLEARVNVTRVNLVKLGVANNHIVEGVLKRFVSAVPDKK